MGVSTRLVTLSRKDTRHFLDIWTPSSVDFLALNVSTLNGLWTPRPSDPVEAAYLTLSFPLTLRRGIGRGDDTGMTDDMGTFYLFVVFSVGWLVLLVW